MIIDNRHTAIVSSLASFSTRSASTCFVEQTSVTVFVAKNCVERFVKLDDGSKVADVFFGVLYEPKEMGCLQCICFPSGRSTHL